MTKTEMKINAMIRVLLAEDAAERKEARENLRLLVNSNVATKQDAETITREILLELGAPDHLVGHPYMIRAILLCVEKWDYINDITFGLYPQLAKEFNTMPSRVERALRHLIEVIFNRCSYEIYNSYFGNTISAEKGKPTNGEFIARIANVVKLRMKQ